MGLEMKFKLRNKIVDAFRYTQDVERVTKNLLNEFSKNDGLVLDGAKVKRFRTDLKCVPKWFDDALENDVLRFHIIEEPRYTDYHLYIYNKKFDILCSERVYPLDVIVRFSDGNLFTMNRTSFDHCFKEVKKMKSKEDKKYPRLSEKQIKDLDHFFRKVPLIGPLGTTVKLPKSFWKVGRSKNK